MISPHKEKPKSVKIIFKEESHMFFIERLFKAKSGNHYLAEMYVSKKCIQLVMTEVIKGDMPSPLHSAKLDAFGYL